MGLYKNTRFYAVHTDHLGTPRSITDDTNKVVWQWSYSAFGDNKPSGILQATPNPADPSLPKLLKATSPNLLVNLRFPGQYWDDEAKLSYNYFRSYQPGQGRYTQSDPIGLAAGWNGYSYVGGNPLSFMDPKGLQATTVNDVARISLPTAGALCAATGGAACAAAAVSAVGVGSYWLADRYVNPWAQPLITKAIDACTKDNTADCDKEWEWAYAHCEKIIQSGNENWREIGKRPPTLQSCAKGYVSQRCGGNRVN